ncbi:MAG TPA: condensation domain-containing protein, partial [Thermoanaerobaculia bacterium]
PRGVPIGRPIATLAIHLLDRALHPVPLGSTGELLIGGVGLARGYLGRPELTAERFVPDPFAGEKGEPGARLYRTGDLARYLPDGAIDYLGRADQQVKLRGFRIELGEIEAALAAHPRVAAAAVLLLPALMGGVGGAGAAGDMRLVAFLVPADGAPPTLDTAELRAYLKQRLPDAMVPAAFVALAELPLSTSGKVDRKALARLAPAAEERAAGLGQAALTPTEEIVAALWAQVLGVPRLARDDDFFALGGHSLLATQVVMRVRDELGAELPVAAVFQAPTVAAFAERVTAARLSGASGEALPLPPAGAIPLLPRDGEEPFRLVAPLSFAQERLWFLDRLSPGGSAYNMPLALRLHGRLDVPALGRVFAPTVARHEALRTTFGEEGWKPVQRVAAPPSWRVPLIDLASLAFDAGSDGGPAEAVRLAAILAGLPFDLATGPLLRTTLVRLAGDDHVLLLAMHHIVSDLWSMAVLVREVAALYPRFVGAGSTPEVALLPELAVQYPEFAVWQRGWLQGDLLARQSAFWRAARAGAPAALELPTDRPRPKDQSFRGDSLLFHLDAELMRAVALLGRRHGATLFMVLASGFATLFSRYSGQDTVVLGTPIANRQRPELAPLIGMFVNTLPLAVRRAGRPACREVRARVRRLALDAYAHQDVPFEKLVEELKPERDLSRHPLFQVVVALQNVPIASLSLPELRLEPVEIYNPATKFDLTITLLETADGMDGRIEFAADLFDPATASRMIAQLATLLAAAAEDSETAIESLPLLRPPERVQLLEAARGATPAYPRDATIHALFRSQAQATPDAVALV